MHRVILAGVIGLLALNAVSFLAGAWTLTRFPFELDYGEGIVLWQADRVLRPSEAYHPIDRYPYTVFHYPPVYHLLARLCRIVIDDPLVAGRVVAWVSALAVALFVGLIAKVGIEGRTKGGVAAAAMASLLVFHLPTIDWVPNMRVDVTALAFSLLGLFVFLRCPGGRGAAVAGAAFVAALFTKQSMIAAPGAALGVLLLTGRTREAATMATVLAAGGGGLAGLLTVITGGEFLRHTVAYNANPFDVAQLAGFMVTNVLGMNALVGLALALPLTLQATRRHRAAVGDHSAMGGQTARRTAVLYFLTAFSVSLTAGKLGAWKNYFLEWNVACCILIGLLLGRVLAGRRRWHRSATATAIVLIVGLVAFTHLGTTVRQWGIVAGRDALLNKMADDSSQALAVMRATPGRVFSDDMTLLMKAGREVPWEPAIATVLAAVGAWDERPALDMITTRQFEVMILRYLDNTLFFSPAIRAAIDHAYTDAGGGAGRYRILRPREVGAGRRDSGQDTRS